MSINWVMLSQKGDIVRLPWEHIQHTKGPRISLELSNAKLPHGRTPQPFSLKCNDGKIYLTTQRVIYLPTKPTAEFKSFAMPILNVEDSRVETGFFSAWHWHAFAKPVPHGGIPPDVVMLEIRLYFNEGGTDEFRVKFEEIKERLHHIREIERETGQRITVPDEPLPAYEAQPSTSSAAGPNSPSAAGPGPIPARPDSSASAWRAPDEPPPNYDEAQAQTLSMRLEDHIRDEADFDESDRHDDRD